MISLGFKIKICLLLFEDYKRKGDKRKILLCGGKLYILRAFQLRSFWKKPIWFCCGMTFLLIWEVVFPFNIMKFFKHTKKVERIDGLYNEYNHHPYSTIHILLYLLDHIPTCTSSSVSDLESYSCQSRPRELIV